VKKNQRTKLKLQNQMPRKPRTKRELQNPMYAVGRRPIEPPEWIVSEAEYIDTNVKMIEREGPRVWLEGLLAVMKEVWRYEEAAIYQNNFGETITIYPKESTKSIEEQIEEAEAFDRRHGFIPAYEENDETRDEVIVIHGDGETDAEVQKRVEKAQRFIDRYGVINPEHLHIAADKDSE